MERYIRQLIQDIRMACQNIIRDHEVREFCHPKDEDEPQDFSGADEFIHGMEKPVPAITGIDVEMLPPEEMLSRNQMARLSKDLEKLLELKHFVLEFPVNFPLHMRYPFIRGFWQENHVEVSTGTIHVEFCQYEPENCPFPDYCHCKDFDDLSESDSDGSGLNFDESADELPF